MSASYNGASLTGGHIPYYLSLLCEWPTSIPLTSMWVCLIMPHNPAYLLGKLARIGGLEVHGASPNGTSWSIAQGINEVWTNQTQAVIGCTYALGVEVPGESVNTIFAGMGDNVNRGFLQGTISVARNAPERLKISFIETNSSFVDMFVRPWTILASHKGLFAYPYDQSIKSTIHMFHLAKTGATSQSIVRKRITYFDAVPVMVPGEANTRSESNTVDARSCEFVYNSYTISDGADVS